MTRRGFFTTCLVAPFVKPREIELQRLMPVEHIHANGADYHYRYFYVNSKTGEKTLMSAQTPLAYRS